LLRCSAVSAIACSKVNYSLIFAATTAEEAFNWVTILKEVCTPFEATTATSQMDKE